MVSGDGRKCCGEQRAWGGEYVNKVLQAEVGTAAGSCNVKALHVEQ
jgi:hypothetical protein